MEINIPKIIREIKLSEFAAEYQEATICVWLNPPKKLAVIHDQLIERSRDASKALFEGDKSKVNEIEQIGKEFERWFIEIWNQGTSETTHWTEPEIEQLVDSDIGLFNWLKKKTLQLIREHRDGIKKD